MTQTIEGTVSGTAAYMSPEQAQGQPLDARSDIFSFGAVLYELLSGDRAFPGESGAAVTSAVLRDEPRPLQAARSAGRDRDALPAQVAGRSLPAHGRREGGAGTTGRLQPPRIRAPPSRCCPFANMSPGKDNEYFSDGLAEEIINALAQVPGLKVIARTSAFAFKGQNTDIRRIAEALGVAHVLEGSVRKAGDRIRVTAQLIKAADGSHLWSERYDRELADVFAVQDEIAGAIAGALKAKLSLPDAAARPPYAAGARLRCIPEGSALPMEGDARRAPAQPGLLRRGHCRRPGVCARAQRPQHVVFHADHIRPAAGRTTRCPSRGCGAAGVAH